MFRKNRNQLAQFDGAFGVGGIAVQTTFQHALDDARHTEEAKAQIVAKIIDAVQAAMTRRLLLTRESYHSSGEW